MEDATDRLAAIEAELARHPADRSPIRHAIARHHQGVALIGAGRTDEAEAALAAAVAGLDVAAVPREHGIACNTLGALLRDTGRPEQASKLFLRAVAAFERSGDDHEAGAAWHNLGLCLRDQHAIDRATAAFEHAVEAIDAGRSPAAASGARRELGACLLDADRAAAATAHLQEAVVLANRARDAQALGAAANVLGLARLADGDPAGAVEAFGRAAAALPRSVRPAGHAMALANLALAHERGGDHRRARLVAAQALVVPDVDPPVRAQAADVLARLGHPTGDLVPVLDDTPREHWPVVVRAEVARWAALDADHRRSELAAWCTAQAGRPTDGLELAEALLGVYLELPPTTLDELVTATVRAADELADEDRVRFRSQVSRAMARFPIPQWTRLAECFTDAAGGEPGWR